MKLFEDKRACWPSFFVSIALVLILALSLFIHNHTIWFVSLSILILLSFFYVKEKIMVNGLSMLIVFFVLLLFLNIKFISRVADAEAFYLIFLFFTVFILATYSPEQFIKNVFYLLSIIFIVISLWGLIQYLSGHGFFVKVGRRANAIFYTPNTYAASINLFLSPLIIFYIMGKAPRYLLGIILLLFSALLVSQSRGGWVAFISSLVFISIFIKRLNFNLNKKRIRNLLIGFVLIFMCYAAIEQTRLEEKTSKINETLLSKNIENLIRSDSVISTMSHRFMLFDIAWQQIKETPILGKGFHTYQYYQQRDQKAPFIGNRTRYAHNDYLQLWMELGLAAVALFVGLFLAMVYYLLRLSSRISQAESIKLMAILTGISSLYVHALVDFMFYVPFILLLYAFYLGLFNQILNKHHHSFYEIKLSSTYFKFDLLKVVLASLIMLFLSKPAIAQLYYNNAVKNANSLNVDVALKRFSLARQFAPDNSDYYWYEGALLMNAVKVKQHVPSAKRADVLFSKGMAIDPYDVKNKLARAELHRDYANLLDEPANIDTIVEWSKAALYWKPNDSIVQSEYLKTLLAMQKNELVETLLKQYLSINPDSEALQEINSLLHYHK